MPTAEQQTAIRPTAEQPTVTTAEQKTAIRPTAEQQTALPQPRLEQPVRAGRQPEPLPRWEHSWPGA